MKRGCLQAGVARIDISPPPGVPHAGWGAQTHQIALGIDMPLYATALVVSQGDDVAVIVDLDLVGFNERQVSAFLHEVESTTGIGADFVRISSTQTHSGPNSFRSDLATQGLEALE